MFSELYNEGWESSVRVIHIYNFNLETTAQTLKDTFNYILMPYLISFGVSSISLNTKNENLTLYPVIWSMLSYKQYSRCPFWKLSPLPPPDTGHILVAYNHKMFPMISSISVQSLVLLS